MTFLHPCKGVKTPPVPKKPRRIISPEQFDEIYTALPSDTMKLLVETDIESGLRWGELTELRPSDLDFATGVLTVSRVVVELDAEVPPRGRPVPRQGLPQGPGVPPAQAQPADRQEDRRSHRATASATRTCSSPMPQVPAAADCGPLPDPAHPRPYQAERRRAPVPARHAQRLLRGQVPVRTLPGRLRHLPGAAPRGREGRPADTGRWTTDGHIPRWWFRAPRLAARRRRRRPAPCR